MPSLSLTGGNQVFSWTIHELGSDFNATYYREAGVAIYSIAYESTYVSGVIDLVTAPSYGTSRSVGKSNIAYSAGTYTFYAYARAANGYYYPAGSASVTIAPPAPQRPQNWNWTNTFISGQTVNVTAAEWNSFCSRVNEFRRYRGLGNYYFTTVYSGQNILASVMREARAAIQGIPGYGAYIPYVSAGEWATAYYFNTLRTELNSIL